MFLPAIVRIVASSFPDHAGRDPKGSARMIISNSHRYIFIHVPQSGCTPIASMLEAELEWNDVLVGSADVGECSADAHARRFGMSQHSVPSEIRRAVSDATYLSYRKICVLREPAARLADATEFVRRLVEEGAPWAMRALDNRERHELRSVRSLRDMLVSDFLQSIIDRMALGLQESLNDIERCVAPQSAYVDEEERQNGRFTCLNGADGPGLADALRSMGIAALRDVGSALAAPSRELANGPVLSGEDEERLGQLFRRDFELLAESASAAVA